MANKTVGFIPCHFNDCANKQMIIKQTATMRYTWGCYCGFSSYSELGSKRHRFIADTMTKIEGEEPEALEKQPKGAAPAPATKKPASVFNLGSV